MRLENVEKAIIYVGLGLAFLKTGEAMVAYAPHGVLGFTADWVSYLWAYLGAFMVEGVLYVAYHKLTERGKDRNARLAAWGVAIISVAFSLTMNKIDTSLNDGTLGALLGNSPIGLLHNVVFAIPLVGAVLFMLLDIIDKATDDVRQPGRSRDPHQGQRNGQGAGQGMQMARAHEPVARWQGGVSVSERPLEGRAALGAGSVDDDITLLGLGDPSSNGRKFQTDHAPMPLLSDPNSVAGRHGR